MYRSQVASANCPPFTLPSSLAQLPLFVLSLLKNPAFTLSSRISYDVRAQTMNLIKSTPLSYLMPTIYPSLYALHSLTEQNVVETETGETVVQAPLLQLSPENTSRYGIFLMDCGHVCHSLSSSLSLVVFSFSLTLSCVFLLSFISSFVCFHLLYLSPLFLSPSLPLHFPSPLSLSLSLSLLFYRPTLNLHRVCTYG
ncbi:Protein transport protein Sec24A [Geodia barretti]|nr:Protein transport protein Sec24A [Geodia barretti]